MSPPKLPFNSRPALAFFLVFSSSVMLAIEWSHAFWLSPSISILFIFICFYYVVAVYKSQKEVALTSFYQIYYMLGLIISAGAIAGGAYMVEVDALGSPNGAFWITVVFFVIGIEATYAGFKADWLSFLGSRVKAQNSQNINLLILVVSVSVISISGYVLIFVGSPIIIGIDRVSFWRQFAPDFLSFVPTLVSQTYFFACYYFLYKKRHGLSLKAASLLLFLYIFIVLFVLGEKFSAFMIFLNAWFMIAAGALPGFRIKPSSILLIFAVFVAILSVVGISYTLSGREFSFIFDRVALQGQLTWSVLEDRPNFTILPNDEWRCYFGCGAIDNGKDYISFQYLPNVLYDFYYDVGSQLSGFVPSLPIRTFGILVAITIHFFVFFLLGLLQKEICRMVRKDNLIGSFLIFKMQFGLILAWLTGLLTALGGVILAASAFCIYVLLFGGRNRPMEKQGEG